MKITSPTIVFSAPGLTTPRRGRLLFCDEARGWLHGRVSRGLRRWSSAWRDCPNGGWMAWWLVNYQDVPQADVEALARQLLGRRYRDYFSNEYTLQDFNEADRLAWPLLLRQHYNWKGERIA